MVIENGIVIVLLESFTLNGEEIEEKQIRLQNDGRVYDVEIIMWF